MYKKRILYIGETKTHDEYMKGNVPSHWFYGAVEMEQDGNEVIWCQESRNVFNDIRLITMQTSDLIFFPNLNIHYHFLLLTLAALGVYRKPIYAYLHREPAIKHGIKSKLYKFLFRGLRHIFFLSEKSLEETVKADLLKRNQCSVPGWGPDMNFFSQIAVSDEGMFVSTGKENRDFDTMVEAFRITGNPLHIITVPSNYTSHYTYLIEKCQSIPNIKVTILNNMSTNYPFLVKEMSRAKALVCPLRKDKLTYCVGLSTIADAEGLGKPLIITDNPYHSGRNDAFSRVKSVEDWVDAINKISSEPHHEQNHFSMSDAYDHMKKIMKL